MHLLLREHGWEPEHSMEVALWDWEWNLPDGDELICTGKPARMGKRNGRQIVWILLVPDEYGDFVGKEYFSMASHGGG